MKDGDFDELRHPLVVEGDFDPVLGFPLAKTSANMIDIIDMLDTANNLSVFVGDDGMLTIRYREIMRSTMVIDNLKGRGAKDASDSVYLSVPIQGSVPISLFRKMRQITDDSIQMQSVLVTLESILNGYVGDSVLAAVDRGAKIYFDSLRLQVECMDGFVKTVPIYREILHVGVHELIAGQHVRILNHYDFADVVRHEPKELRYSITMNLTVPMSAMQTDADAFMRSLSVDSIVASMDAQVDFPMQFNCHNLVYNDTLDVDASALDSLLFKVEENLTLNDSASYLVIESKNEIPVAFSVNATLLGAQGEVVMRRLFDVDSTLAAAPIAPNAGKQNYISDGYAKSRLVIPIDMPMLHNLSRTRMLSYRLTASTAQQMPAGKVEKPIIEVRQKDKLDLRAYVVVSPHVHLSLSTESIPTLK